MTGNQLSWPIIGGSVHPRGTYGHGLSLNLMVVEYQDIYISARDLEGESDNVTEGRNGRDLCCRVGKRG